MPPGQPSDNKMAEEADEWPALSKRRVMPLTRMLVPTGSPAMLQGPAEICFAVAARPARQRSASDAANLTHTMHPIVMRQVLPAILSDAPSSPVTDAGSPLTQMEPLHVSGSTWKVVAPKQVPVTMPTVAPSAPPPSMERLSALATELDKCPTPYIAEGFRKALEDSFLMVKYPSLVHDLIHGSPIGAPAPLTHMTIMPNLMSARLQPDVVTGYITKEVVLGHMSGPFTLEETHHIFKGHFRTVPVGLVEKDPTKGTFQMIQHFSKEDELGVSVNSQLDSDDFPTRWHSAYTMADYVRLPCYQPLPSWPPFCFCPCSCAHLMHMRIVFGCTHALFLPTLMRPFDAHANPCVPCWAAAAA